MIISGVITPGHCSPCSSPDLPSTSHCFRGEHSAGLPLEINKDEPGAMGKVRDLESGAFMC